MIIDETMVDFDGNGGVKESWPFEGISDGPDESEAGTQHDVPLESFDFHSLSINFPKIET